MSAVQALRPTNQPPRTPERTALAAAIAAETEAKRAATSARDAVQRASRMAEQAAAKLDAASADAAKVKDAQASRMAEAATKGTPLTPDQSIRNARAHEVDAQDDFDAARAALASVEAALADAQDAHREAEKRLGVAVGAVMATGALQLLEELAELQARTVEARIVLRSLSRALGESEAARTISEFLGRAFLMPELNHETRPACGSWAGAFDPLRQSADAPLPTG
jgi:DNA repair exonuclease SbcCD ATPase subunit